MFLCPQANNLVNFTRRWVNYTHKWEKITHLVIKVIQGSRNYKILILTKNCNCVNQNDLNMLWLTMINNVALNR